MTFSRERRQGPFFQTRRSFLSEFFDQCFIVLWSGHFDGASLSPTYLVPFLYLCRVHGYDLVPIHDHAFARSRETSASSDFSSAFPRLVDVSCGWLSDGLSSCLDEASAPCQETWRGDPGARMSTQIDCPLALFLSADHAFLHSSYCLFCRVCPDCRAYRDRGCLFCLGCRGGEEIASSFYLRSVCCLLRSGPCPSYLNRLTTIKCESTSGWSL